MEGLGTYQNRLLELGSDMRPENKKQIMTLLRDLANEFTNTLVITFPDEKTKGLFEASKGDIDTLKSEVSDQIQVGAFDPEDNATYKMHLANCRGKLDQIVVVFVNENF